MRYHFTGEHPNKTKQNNKTRSELHKTQSQIEYVESVAENSYMKSG